MARATETTKREELIRRAEKARVRLGMDYVQFRKRMDVPARVKRSLQTNPRGWAIGSVVAGLVLSRLFRRKKTPEKYGDWRVVEQPRRRKPGFFGFIGAMVTLVSPMIFSLAKSWVGNQARAYLSSHVLPRLSLRMSPTDSRFPKTR